ncbi:PREDICTED: protein LZIC-like [Diuraphis noxia]|uniref:protein LZIC-like n=1 Tax=Diuraphis noxia TaxID=143948 RepID=UPI0007637775|nr:PREDICTED: protein LZIC-like [Diuraphis noxia]
MNTLKWSVMASFCASITKTFQTPSIAKMFAKNELNALREKCKQIKNDIRLCKLNLMEGKRQKLEVLCALKCLGCELTNEDKMFIRSEIRNIHSCAPM